MPRPIKKRHVCAMPEVCEFHPCDRQDTGAVELGVDEFEALRLIDYLRLNQDECAIQMSVARTTVQAVYNSARQKVADALVNGKSLVITGGNYDLCPQAQSCCGKNCVNRDCGGKVCTGCGGCECMKRN